MHIIIIVHGIYILPSTKTIKIETPFHNNFLLYLSKIGSIIIFDLTNAFKAVLLT